MTGEPLNVPNTLEPTALTSVPAPAQTARETGKVAFKNPYVWGTGRRKTAVARVRIRPGAGKFLVNDREVPEFFRIEKDRHTAKKPLEVTSSAKSFDVFVNVCGGGITGQAGAVCLGLARALAKTNSEYEPKLREARLLTRDPRRVERKKYGRPGARRRFQFSKR